MIRLFKVKEKQKEEAENANGKGPFKEHSAGELRLHKENYSAWRRSIQIALSAKNKLMLVRGTFKAPAENTDLWPHWQRANDMVLSWIFNVVSEEISNSLSFATTAAEVWKELEERFSVIDGHKIFQLERNLQQIVQAYGMIRQEERQRQGFDTGKLPAVVLNSTGYMSHLTHQGHDANVVKGPKQFGKNGPVKSSFKEGVICSYCHREGHYKSECYKLIGFPVGHPAYGKISQSGKNTTNAGTMQEKPNPKTLVTVASGEHDKGEIVNGDNLEEASHARLDQMQNQLNQMMMMLQNAAVKMDNPDSAHMAGGTGSVDFAILSLNWNIKPGRRKRMVASKTMIYSIIYYINDHFDKRTWTYIFGACCATTVFILSFHNYRIWSFLGLGMTTYVTWYFTIAASIHGQTRFIVMDNVFCSEYQIHTI